jgi:hypothetical protein
MQSVDIGANAKDIVHLQTQVMQLEQMMVYLVAKTALGQGLTMESPTVKKFLHVQDGEDVTKAATQVVRSMEGRFVTKIVTCPSCGAGVRDLPGVTDETCNWCGTQLRTEA